MNVLITVGSNRLRIFPRLPEDLLKKARDSVKYRLHNYQFTEAYKNYNWDGYKYPLFKNQTAPAGLYLTLKRSLERLGCTVDVEFSNKIEAIGSGDIYGLTPDDFQKKATKKAIKARYGIISAKIRSGKTAIIAMLCSKIGQFPIWVITDANRGGKEVVVQTQKALSEHLHVDVGIFSEGKFVPGDVVVSSYAALNHGFITDKKKRKRQLSDKIIERNKAILEHAKSAKALILDECHHAFSKKAQAAIEQFSRIGFKIGLSGTPRPDKLTKTEVEMGIGPIITKGSFKALIDKGRLAKPKVIVYDLPYKWFSSYFTEYHDVYWTHVIENEYRNRFIADAAKKLMQRGKSVFIMIQRLQHGPNLRALIPGSVLVHGSIKTDTRKKLYTALEKGSLKCIITTVGKEGLNLPKLDAVINAEGLSGKVVTIQKLRSLTASEGKKYGLVIDFLDKGKYLFDHSEQRLAQYKRQRGFEVKQKNVPVDYFGEIE